MFCGTITNHHGVINKSLNLDLLINIIMILLCNHFRQFIIAAQGVRKELVGQI